MKEFHLRIHCPCCAAIFTVEKTLCTLPNVAVSRQAWDEFDRLGDDRIEVLEILQVRMTLRKRGKQLAYYSAAEVLDLCEVRGEG